MEPTTRQVRPDERAARTIRELCPHRPLRVLVQSPFGRPDGRAGAAVVEVLRALAAGGDVEILLVAPPVRPSRPPMPAERELKKAGVAYRVCTDRAAPGEIAAGRVDCVLAAGRAGDREEVTSAVGSYALAVVAAHHGIPFFAVTPRSDPLPPAERAPSGNGDSIDRVVDTVPAELATVIGGQPPLTDLLRSHIKVVPDFPTPGIQFQDLCPVYTNPTLLRRLAAAVVTAYQGRFTHVAGVEARGFLLGTVVSQLARKPLVLLRKKGKLPGPVDAHGYGLEYAVDTMEVQRDAFPRGADVLVVDDVLATGGTLDAAAALVEGQGARLAGFAVLVEISALDGRSRLAPRPLFSVLRVDD